MQAQLSDGQEFLGLSFTASEDLEEACEARGGAEGLTQSSYSQAKVGQHGHHVQLSNSFSRTTP